MDRGKNDSCQDRHGPRIQRTTLRLAPRIRLVV